MAHLLPVVLREIDDLKRGGRTEQQREGAKRADRRLKGLRDNGDVLSGVRVAGEVYAVFEHIEPRDDRLPSWLDLTVPDDRFAASCMLLQSEHPGSALYVATGDINLQTKLTAIGLPVRRTPPRLPDTQQRLSAADPLITLTASLLIAALTTPQVSVGLATTLRLAVASGVLGLD